MPWRHLWAAGLLTLFATLMTVTPAFTGLGHVTAGLLGLAAYAVTRGRRGLRGADAVLEG